MEVGSDVLMKDVPRVLEVTLVSALLMEVGSDALIVLLGLIANLVVRSTTATVPDASREFFLAIQEARSLEVKPKKSK